MSDCLSIDPLVTPFVDGELSGAERDRLERHLRRCPPCYSRVEAERAVRTLLRTRQPAFKGECAPAALRMKCAGHCSLTGTRHGVAGWRRHVMSLAAAAVIVLGAGGVFLYQATSRSSRALAAELTTDHLKCFMSNDAQALRQTPATVEAALASGFDWAVHLPEGAGRDDLQLVGSRTCLYEGGPVAHIMYRHHGEPMSLFMLPKSMHPREVVESLGHVCAIWSSNDRTFVLVSREPRAEVERLAAVVQPSFH